MPEFLDAFLEATAIAEAYDTDAAVWTLAGMAYGAYAARRRQSGEGQPKRLLAEFIIGAHAQVHADRLATLDARRYSQDFPRLLLV